MRGLAVFFRARHAASISDWAERASAVTVEPFTTSAICFTDSKSPWEAEVERGDLAALSWQNPDLHVYTHMAHHKEKWISPIIESFIEAAREVFAEKGNKMF